jgi:hypothetical protein
MSLNRLFFQARTLQQLNAPPTAEDVAIGWLTVFYDLADPTDIRRINAAGTAYVAISSGSGGGGSAQDFASLGYFGGNIDNSIDGNTARLFNNAAFEGRGCSIVGGGGYTDTSLAPDGPSLTFSALSGSGVTMTCSASSIALTGIAANDVFRRFSFGNGVSALVTATASNGLSCTVTIEGGALPSLTIPVTGWTVAPDFDSNGFPRCASVYCLSANFQYGGPWGEALVAPGTYHVTIKSQSPSIGVSFPNADGMSTTTPVVTGPASDGYTLKFDFTVTAGVRQVVTIAPNAGITFIDVPRDGAATTVGQPLFYAKALAYYCQFRTLRLMDFMNTNGRTDVNWVDRPRDYAVARNRYSWEFLVDFLNALKAYPGSSLQKAILCTPPFATPAYSASLAQLLNARGLSPSLIMWIQRGNEEWNTTFKMFYNDTNLAYAEVQAIAVAGYGNYMPRVTSAVGDGTTITVTLAAALPSYITAGAQFVVSGGGWTQGTLASPVTVGTASGSVFTYPSSITGALVTTTQTAWFFSLISSLLGYGLTGYSDLNLYHTVYAYHVRAQYQNWNAWKVYRPQDKFMLDSQFSNSGVTTVSLAMASAVNGGDPTWAYGMMFAPYPQPTGTTLDGSSSDLFVGTTGFITQLPAYATTMKSNIYACKAVGLHPVCYEGGPDYTYVSNHALIVAANRDQRMLTFIRDLWKAWLQNGGEEWCHYQVSPSFAEVWSTLDNYDDTAAPKMLGVQAGGATPVLYVDSTAADSTNYKAQSINGQLNANGVRYPYTAGVRTYTHFFTKQGGQYSVGIEGTTGQAGTQVTLTLDGSPWGSPMTLANNGTPQSGAAALPNVDPFIVTIPAGYHILKINFPAYVGAGYKRVTFAPA